MAFIIWRRGSTNNRGNRGVFGATSSSTGGSGEPGAGSFGSGPNWIPRAVNVSRITVFQNTAPGAGAMKHIRLKSGNNISETAAITISGLQTEADVSFSPGAVQLPAVDTTSDTTLTNTQNYYNEWVDGANPSAASNIAVAAEIDGNPDISYYAYGQPGAGGITIGASDRWSMIVDVDSGEASEAAAQTPWPVTGKFKDFSVVWENLTAANEAVFAMRINGADVITFTVTGAGGTKQGMRDIVSEIDVEEGDLVNWRVLRTTGADTSVSIVITFGFTTK